MLSRVPIEEAIERAKIESNASLYEQLLWVQPMRLFASEQLGLPSNNSYTQFAKPAGDYPVYTVVAAPEFSITAKQWCYPIIGCASYRGFFQESDAIKYAKSQQDRGYETSIGGATAYSTLGWFADPVLPSMLRFGKANFAEVLFHELAHQQLYVNGDSSFNEAFATVVGEIGAQRWVQQHAPEKLSEYKARLSALKQFNDLLSGVKSRLEELYASDAVESELRKKKAELISQLKEEYAQLSAVHWQGRNWFEPWFAKPVNNARLAAFSTYHQRVPELLSLLSKCDDNLVLFYRQLAKLESVDGQVTIPRECKT